MNQKRITKELIEAVKRSDRKAYNIFKDQMIRIVRRGNSRGINIRLEDLEDITNEVIVRVLQELPKYNEKKGASLSTWIYKTAYFQLPRAAMKYKYSFSGLKHIANGNKDKLFNFLQSYSTEYSLEQDTEMGVPIVETLYTQKRTEDLGLALEYLTAQDFLDGTINKFKCKKFKPNAKTVQKLKDDYAHLRLSI